MGNLENKIRGIIEQYARTRLAAHENGHQVDINSIPEDQEIILMIDPGYRECADTKYLFETPVNHPAYNQSVSLDWLQIDPAEDGTLREKSS